MSVRPASRIVRAISFGVFCRMAPSTSAIIDRGRSRPDSRDPDHDPVGQHPGAAGHARAVAADFADHGRRLAGDGRLVDRCDALDDLAVAGNHLARPRRHRSPLAQLSADAIRSSRRRARRSAAPCLGRVLRSVSAWALPRPSAIASAKFANSTVNQSQSAIWIANTSCRRGRPTRSRTRSAWSARCRPRRRTSPGSAAGDAGSSFVKRALAGAIAGRAASRDRRARHEFVGALTWSWHQESSS